MSDASELPPSAPKSAEPHPLDTLTGGALSAETSGDRAACLRQWLASEPAPSTEQLQEVLKELNARDKSAARLVRERLDEIRRTQDQDLIIDEWAAKAQALLQSEKLDITQANAWQRDAAKAAAPLSREPLASLRQQLAERIKSIEEVQHKVQVQREVAVLLTQRIEVLSTKPWRDAQQTLDSLGQDVQHWQAQAEQLRQEASWPAIEERFTQQLESVQSQLLLVWQAFTEALSATEQAAADAQAPLPAVPVWADEIRVSRGLPSELAASVPGASAGTHTNAANASSEASNPKPAAADPAQKQQAAQAALEPALAALAQTQPQTRAQDIATVRNLLKQHGRWLSEQWAEQAHQQLLAAGDTQGWQPALADEQRQTLIAQMQSLLQRPEGQTLGGRKLQEQLRQARQEWRQIDQSAAPNHGLWKQFDAACTTVYQQVQQWLERRRAETGDQKAQRLALLEELKAWAQTQIQAQAADWKESAHALRQFSQRWRDAGHLPDKLFAELQTQWRQAMQEAEAPLRAAQKANIALRQELIAQAKALAEGTELQVDTIKALQQRWQEQAQAVPLERKQEQKLWEAFRQPIDSLFSRNPAPRNRNAPGGAAGHGTAAPLSAQDQRVLEAAKAVQAASASDDAEQIRSALAALEAAKQAQAAQRSEATPGAGAGEDNAGAENAAAPAEAAASPAPAAARPLVAVRGDDRPGARQEAPSPAPAAGRRDERKGRRPERSERLETGRFARTGQHHEREPRPERGPRLGDAAFRAQRNAVDAAEQALRKIAQQAHGQALTELLHAWSERNPQAIPSQQALGGKLNAAGRSAWVKALEAPSGGDAGHANQPLLRLEVAADVPSPAAQQTARSTLKLQLLTQRNAALPQDTWVQDVAQVLASAHSEEAARRLQSALKPLLRSARAS